MRVVSNYVRSLRTYHTATKAFACLLGSLLMELSVGLREFLAEFSRKPLRHGLSRATSPKWEAQMAGGLCVKSAYGTPHPSRRLDSFMRANTVRP